MTLGMLDLGREVRTERSGLFDVDREWRMTWCGDWVPGLILSKRSILTKSTTATLIALGALPMFRSMIAAIAEVEQSTARIEAALRETYRAYPQRWVLGVEGVASNDPRNAQDDLHTSRALAAIGHTAESMLVWLSPQERELDLDVRDVLRIAGARRDRAMQLLRTEGAPTE